MRLNFLRICRFWLLCAVALCVAPAAFANPKNAAPRATVTVFLATDCPLARRVVPRLAKIGQAFETKGIRFVAAFPNTSETPEACQKFTQSYRLAFPIVQGEDAQTLARRYGATVSPEVVVTDTKGIVRYRGDVDDRDTGDPKNAVPDLSNALLALVHNKPVARPRTRARGCSLVLPGINPIAAAPTTTINYARDIAPILNAQCVECHRSGEVGPFALDTYAQAARWAKSIKTVTEKRTMPPWNAESNGEFHNERRLTDAQIGLLATWAENGTPPGDLKTAPPTPTFPTGWKLGAQPDAVFTMPQPYDVPATGKDIYQCFVVPTNLEADKWVAGVEYKPGNAQVVHHVSVFLDTSGAARKLAKTQGTGDGPMPSYRNPTPGNGPGFSTYVGQLGGWTPGHAPRKLPPGVGIVLPKGADIVLEVHYHLSGKPEKDQSKMGVYFASGPVTKRLRLADISSVTFVLPPGNADYPVEAFGFVPENLTLLGVTPHLHNLGKSMRVSALLPDGTYKLLVDVSRWDFRWQPSYRFKEPLKLPRGTRIDVSARFDNSDTNPNNPHRPSVPVRWGESTDDEMCTAFLAYTLDNEDLTKTLPEGVPTPR